MKLSIVLAVSAIIVGSFGAALGGSAEQARYRSPDPDISRVQFGGVWSEGKRSGQVRAVVRTRCSDDCYDDLFVEWLEPVGTRRVLVGTKRVEQIGGRHQITRLEFLDARGENHLEVEHRTGGETSSDRWTICLALDGPNRYASTDGRCRR
jgi:hypothetical protein